MKIYYKRFILLVIAIYISACVSSQTLGTELTPQGTSGTVASEGRNGDGGIGENIYPNLNSPNIRIYYQLIDIVFHNGILVHQEVNPGVIIGPPLIERSDYIWGMSEVWESNAYNLPNINGENTWERVSHAPNNGYYLIINSTRGMYNLPPLNSANWFQIYDK